MVVMVLSISLHGVRALDSRRGLVLPVFIHTSRDRNRFGGDAIEGIQSFGELIIAIGFTGKTEQNAG
jgi:hypothetical protein